MDEVTNSTVERIRCESAEEFLRMLHPTNPLWESDGLESKWLYRGHRNANRKLHPAAWRDPKDNIQLREYRSFLARSGIVDRHMAAFDVDHPSLEISSRDEWSQLERITRETRIREFVTQIILETQLVRDFWTIADDVGHRLPKPDWNFSDNCVASLILRAGNGDGEGLFQHMAFATAQHHRIPTRLLDWSYNPLVAAYFAASVGTSPKAEFIEVWALRRDAILRASNLREYHVPRSELSYLHAQSGCFLWIEHPTSHFLLTGNWPTQDAVLDKAFRVNSAGGPRPPWAYRISLPASDAPTVTQSLWRARVSHAHVMPTLDNVAEEVWHSLAWRTKGSLQQ